MWKGIYMKINEILAENITKDYFNAKVKTEVIFDTILTPVIGEILTVIGRENKKLKINDTLKTILIYTGIFVIISLVILLIFDKYNKSKISMSNFGIKCKRLQRLI